MSDFVKGELEIVQVSLSTYQIWVKPKPNRKAVLVARSLNEDDAKELVRRWNAFEDGGLVDELRTAYLVIKGMVGNVDHTKGHGENSAKMRGDMLNSIRELVEAALAKS